MPMVKYKIIDLKPRVRALGIVDPTLTFMDTFRGQPLSYGLPELPVPGGELIIEVINRLVLLKELGYYQFIFMATDWHPHRPIFNEDHISFAVRHGLPPQGQSVDTPNGVQQVWNGHGKAGSVFANIHPDLLNLFTDFILRTGTDPEVDSYSAFADSRNKSTGLGEMMLALGITDVDFTGLARNIRLRDNALHSRQRLNFNTRIVEDGTKGVDIPEGSIMQADEIMKAAGIQFTNSSAIFREAAIAKEMLDIRVQELLAYQYSQTSRQYNMMHGVH